jgi:Ca2+-binding RTX toxin-like protein
MLNGGEDNDRVYGYAGNDFLEGWSGNDKLYGEFDDDELRGGEGDDRLEGGSGNDRLYGYTGMDTLIGGEGDDWLAGEWGHDWFEFFGNFGADRVADFVAGAGSEDTIVLSRTHTFTSVMASARQSGADTVLDFGNFNTITLEGVSLASLHADDFLFL